jgi:hypothetical protein
MPDAPDFSEYALQGTKDTLHDLGELAARQDARDVWDRRGQVVWFDRFEGGLGPWGSTGSGTGNLNRIDTSNTEWGGYACLMKAGSDGSHLAEILRFFPIPEVNAWGAEVGMSLRSEFEEFRVYLSRTLNAVKVEVDVILDRVNNVIKIRLPGGAFQTLGVLPNPINTYALYHHLKVVGDFRTGKYVRVIYNATEFDVSAYAMYTEADASPDNQEVKIWFVGRAGFNDLASVGHAIITVGEP